MQDKKSLKEQLQHNIPFWSPVIKLYQYTACLGETKGDVQGKTEAANKTKPNAKQIKEDQTAQTVERG